jgi:hypothetical protein
LGEYKLKNKLADRTTVRDVVSVTLDLIG